MALPKKQIQKQMRTYGRFGLKIASSQGTKLK